MFTVADHVLALLVGVVVPLLSARSSTPESRRAIASDPALRRAVIGQSATFLWFVTTLVLGAAWLRGADSESLGLSPAGGEPGLAAAWGLAVVFAAALIVRGQRVLRDPERRRRTLVESVESAPFLPRSRSEQRLWIWLSFTAGLCEEIIFRGFLVGYALAWMTGDFGTPDPREPAAWVAGLFVSLAFGAAHLYQGRRMALRITVAGSSFALLYVLSGSLWPSILLHAFVDVHEGWIWSRLWSLEGAGSVTHSESDRVQDRER